MRWGPSPSAMETCCGPTVHVARVVQTKVTDGAEREKLTNWFHPNLKLCSVKNTVKRVKR